MDGIVPHGFKMVAMMGRGGDWAAVSFEGDWIP